MENETDKITLTADQLVALLEGRAKRNQIDELFSRKELNDKINRIQSDLSSEIEELKSKLDQLTQDALKRP
ncbi:hypothetical protein [Vibrio paucivorans]